MKSEPGRSVVYTSARGAGGLVSAATKPGPGSGVTARACAAGAVSASGTPGPTAGPTSAAAPAAAPFRKRRRLIEPFLELGMVQILLCWVVSILHEVEASANLVNRSDRCSDRALLGPVCHCRSGKAKPRSRRPGCHPGGVCVAQRRLHAL